jgi:hypothetical protein
MTAGTTLVAHRIRPADLARLSAVGMRSRKLRAALSALGIAIGVAAIVAVLGLSSSSKPGCSTRSANWAPTCSPSPTARRSAVTRPNSRAPPPA